MFLRFKSRPGASQIHRFSLPTDLYPLDDLAGNLTSQSSQCTGADSNSDLRAATAAIAADHQRDHPKSSACDGYYTRQRIQCCQGWGDCGDWSLHAFKSHQPCL